MTGVNLGGISWSNIGITWSHGLDDIVGKTYQTYNSLPPCQEIDISCHKLSQNDHFVGKHPSLVIAVLKLRFGDHVTTIFLLNMVLIWCGRTAPYGGWIALTRFLVCDLTCPNCLDNPKLTFLGLCFVVEVRNLWGWLAQVRLSAGSWWVGGTAICFSMTLNIKVSQRFWRWYSRVLQPSWGEHGCDATPPTVVTINEFCGPPVDLVNVLGIIRVSCGCTIFNSTMDEWVIGYGLGLLGTVFEIPSDVV